MIKLLNIKKEYKLKNRQVTALNGVSLQLPERGLVFITGENGGGKSTLLNILGGVDCRYEGDTCICGKSVKDFKQRDFDAYRNNFAGIVIQSDRLLEKRTVGENIALALEIQGEKPEREQIERAMREFSITDKNGNAAYEIKAEQLSNKQKLRLFVARAAIKDPKIILADEPHLLPDGEKDEQIYSVFKIIAKQKLVVVATDDKEIAEKYGDRVIELENGRIASDSVANCTINGQNCNATYERGRSGKIPFEQVVALSFSAIKQNFIKIVAAIILAILSLTLIGFNHSINAVDTLTAELKTAYGNDVKTVVLCGRTVSSYKSYLSLGSLSSSISHTGKDNTFLSSENIKKLESEIPILPLLPQPNEQFDFLSSPESYLANLNEDALYNPYVYSALNKQNYKNVYYQSKFISRVVETDPKTGESDANLTSDPRLSVKSRLPENFNEIAITDYHADLFMRLGFKDVDGDGAVYEIETPDNLIGKTIAGLKICGIYKTSEDIDKFKDKYDFVYNGKYRNGNSFNNLYLDDIDNFIKDYSRGFHVFGFGFVKSGFYESYTGEKLKDFNVLYNLAGDVKKDKALFEKISYIEEDVNGEQNGSHTRTKRTAGVITSYSGFIDKKINKTEIAVNQIYMITAGIIAALLSIFLFAYSLVSGIEDIERETEFFRAMGASKKSTLLISAFISVFIAVTVLALSLSVLGIVCLSLNAQLYLPLLSLGLVPFGAVFISGVVIIGLPAVLSVVKAIQTAPKGFVK